MKTNLVICTLALTTQSALAHNDAAGHIHSLDIVALLAAFTVLCTALYRATANRPTKSVTREKHTH